MAEPSTRESLIEVGVGLMHRHGFTATGLAEILQQAGVPKGSFYHHFGSKQEFAVAVLERYAAREGEHAAAVLGDAEIPPVERLKRYFGDLVKLYGQTSPIPGCLMGRFSLEVAELSAILRQHLSASFAAWQAGLASVIGEAIERNELPAGTDAEALAGFLLNSWEGALLRSEADQSDAPLHGFLHFVFEGMLRNTSPRVS